jgi:CubicO group peptidase (beta-lactamase class C family)
MRLMALSTEKFDAVIEPMLRAARIPGAAIAVVVGDEMVLAKNYGLRDLEARLPMTTDTLYPIASTTKPMTATLLGMLVDEGRLEWDVPVQNYLPGFRLGDPMISAQVTVHDLLLMRTGLPRHDWMWSHRAITRAELVERLRHLELSHGFRERFQYNNLTVTAAGHIAEVITGQSWEALVRERLLEPLGMCSSTFGLSPSEKATASYRESATRELQLTSRSISQATAPSGGALCSTVEDMARWIAFNLSGGKAQGRQLIQAQTLAEISAPALPICAEESPPSPGAMRALGWTVDRYNGHARVSHGGLLMDVSSDVTLYPEFDIGLVCFVNFAAPLRAKLINQYAFDLLMNGKTSQTWEDQLAKYANSIEETSRRNSAVRRVEGTSPSHSLNDHAGRYQHRAYGEIEIRNSGGKLDFRLNDLNLSLEHWHYDSWVAKDSEVFPRHIPHEFDKSSRIQFVTNAEGDVAQVAVNLEATVRPVSFERVYD